MTDEPVLSAVMSKERLKRQATAIKGKYRFVHYTSGEAAVSILSKKVIWLKNSRLMNDYSEIDYGVDLIRRVLFNGGSLEFWAEIRRITQLDSSAFEKTFESEIEAVRSNTYILSMCEHGPDNDIGRLSMWRGYGTTAGVALVANPVSDFLMADIPSTVFYPVLYEDQKGFQKIVNRITRDLIAVRGTLGNADVLVRHLRDFLKTVPFYLKNEGFVEEQEWRVVYNPKSRPKYPGTDTEIELEASVQSIRGLPQLVYQLPLDAMGNSGRSDIGIEALIHKIIVGPSTYPEAVRTALEHLIDPAGIHHTSSGKRKVVLSSLPYRSV